MTPKKKFTETFRSPVGFETETEALNVLNKIREAHPAEAGWHEEVGYVEKTSNGKFFAVRVHTHIPV